jgi:hypothetical protein
MRRVPWLRVFAAAGRHWWFLVPGMTFGPTGSRRRV